MITANKQIAFDGLDLFGDTFEVQSVEGLGGMPALRTGDLVIAGRDGQRFGVDRLDPRTVTIEVAIYAFSDAEFYAAVDALRAAFQPATDTTKLLQFQFGGIAGGGVRRLNCRPRALALPIERTYWHEMAVATAQLVAADPLIYDDTLSSGETSLPSAGGGMEFDATFDLTFGAVSQGGTIYAVNAGTWWAEPLIRVDGPVTNPRVENITTGQTLELDLTVADGEFALFDVAARTVLLNGTASRYANLTDDSVWWRLAPGMNEITFRASTPSVAELHLTWRSAWL